VTGNARPPEYRRLAGAALLALALIMNPWVLGWILAPDGSIDGEARNWQIITFTVFCSVAGTGLWSRALQSRLQSYLPNMLAGVTLVVLLTGTIVGSAWGIWAYQTSHQHTHYTGVVQPPTDAERNWADRFVQQSLDSAARHGWFDLAQAERGGFSQQWSDGEHWVNREYLFDDRVLDPARPEFLMYDDSPQGKVLTGFMYYTRDLEEKGPTPGGSIAQWHYHPWPKRGFCAERGLLVVSRPDDRGNCSVGVRVSRSGEMLHVWFVDHPLGPFADVMQFPQDKSMRDWKLLHPLVVHFGLALVIVSVLLDLGAWIARKPALHATAAVNLLIGAIAVIAAVATGMMAEVQLTISHEVHQVLDTHKLLAFCALAGVVVLTGWRLRLGGRFPHRGAVMYLALGLLTATLTAAAGHRGAEMVFVHGTAVQAIDRFAMERYKRSVYRGQTIPATSAVTTTHGAH
jgi:uncharacterized membrane protein